MTTSYETTQLDFDSIKNNLKLYLQQQSEFSDYNFEASGLSNILDVLAYNTHYNALIANFSLNEAYLSSAQLRSSVVSIAQTLGYKIRSRSASVANVQLSLNLSSAAIKPTSITLPIGTAFTSSVDGVAYTFQTQDIHAAVNDGSGVYTFTTENGDTDVAIYEGQTKTKTFIVQEENERQIFLIPDETIDTTLARVNVYDTFNSSNFVSYTDIFDATTITSASTFYKILETPNSVYELSFGDGQTTGVKPSVGNKVVVSYLSCVGADANAASSFIPVSQITVNAVNYDLTVSVTASSYNGSSRQSIESIRQNAPLGFASQRRLVTAQDYESTILSNFSSVSDVVAWGGEDNDPPNYGAVYVGLLFNDGVSSSASATVKDTITSTMNENLAILSVDVKFVDPIITYLEIETTFSFNPNTTSVTQSTLESQVLSQINTYVDDNLKVFSGIFRKSNLASDIDTLSSTILSTEIETRLNQRLTPIDAATSGGNSSSTTYNLSFPVAISAADDVTRSVTSTSFDYGGIACTVKNKLSSTKLQIVDAFDTVIIDNIGSFTPTSGKITLVGFDPGVITSGDDYIKITIRPANDNVIKPLRNYYFDLDQGKSFAAGLIDRNQASVNLT